MKVILTTLLMILLASTAPAEALTSIAQLGPGYVHEDGRTIDTFITIGQPYHLVGFVSAFEGPLAHLDVDEPGVEYTWAVMDAQSCGGALADKDNCAGVGFHAAGGWFRLVRDTTPDADLSDPATFYDGEILLEGAFPACDLADPAPAIMLFGWSCGSSGNPSGADFTLDMDLNGGSLWPYLNAVEDEVRCVGVGTFDMWIGLPEEVLDAGYFARVDFTLRADSPIAVQTTSWGRLKTLYK